MKLRGGIFRGFLQFLFFLLFSAGGIQHASAANTVSATVADYNSLLLVNSVTTLTVPATNVVYTVTSGNTPVVGSSFVVTLPAGMVFFSTPSLSSTGSSTFTLSSGGAGSQSATFLLQTANAAAGDSFKLASFQVNPGSTLRAPVAVANALPVSMQAIGIDASPLSAGLFASQAATVAGSPFVAAIQFVYPGSPSNGTLFGTSPSLLAATIVYAATAISLQNGPLLNPDGTTFTISNEETGSWTINTDFTGISQVFLSSTSDCTSSLLQGQLLSSYVASFPTGVPLNQEVFLCVTSAQTVPLHATAGVCNVMVGPGAGVSDFVGGPVNDEFPGLIAYYSPSSDYYSPANTQCGAVPVPSSNRYGLAALSLLCAVATAWFVQTKRKQ